MPEYITATFRDGAFVPEVQTNLAAGTRVKLFFEPMEEASDPAGNSFQQFDNFCDEIAVAGGRRLSRQELHDHT